MAGYRAGPGNGFLGSHTTPPRAPLVDVGGALDSLTQGATSLIAQAYGLKRQKLLDQQARDELAYRHSRDTIADQRYSAEQNQRQIDSERRFQLDSQRADVEAREKGYTPPHTETQAVPAATEQVTPLSPIQRAMSASLPGPQYTPSSDPTSQALAATVNQRPAAEAAPLPAIGGPISYNRPQNVETPASYDPTHSSAYMLKAADRQRIHDAAVSAGIPDGKAELAAADPAIAARLLAPTPKTPHVVQDASGKFHIVNLETGTTQPVLGADGKQVVGKLPAAGGDHFTFPVGADENGNPIVLRANTKTGEVQSTGQAGKQGAAGGQAAMNTARLNTAGEQAQSADSVMTEFEKGLLSGKKKISASASAAAKMMMGGGPVTSSLAETTLNKLDPDVAQYVRAAKTIATAERMISPRGGSNAMSHAEGILSGAGPGATPELIGQAQAYRRALMHGISSHAGPSSGGSPRQIRKPGGANVSAPAKGTAGNDTPGDIDLGAPSAAASPGVPASNPFGDLIPTRPAKKP